MKIESMRSTVFNTAHLFVQVCLHDSIHTVKLAPFCGEGNYIAVELNAYQFFKDIDLMKETLRNTEFHLFQFLSDWSDGFITYSDNVSRIFFNFGFAERPRTFCFHAGKPFLQQIIKFEEELDQYVYRAMAS